MPIDCKHKEDILIKCIDLVIWLIIKKETSLKNDDLTLKKKRICTLYFLLFFKLNLQINVLVGLFFFLCRNFVF